MPTLHALLVGIDKYEHIRNLAACAKDVARLQHCLEQYFPDLLTEQSVRILLNGEARKQAIVDAFEEHLIEGDIKPGDILLFYFSGHGAQEAADPVFWEGTTDQKLENLACHDSHSDSGRNFLADKELRYLIHRAARPEVEMVTIFDCCHAGDNTRSVDPDPKIRERLTSNVPMRDWKDFIFAKGYNESEQGLTRTQFENMTDLNQILPQGFHIQLGACDRHESAKEIESDGGIFTSALIDTIKAFKGRINYYELNAHIRSYVRRGFQQHPQLYIYSGAFKAEGRQSRRQQALFRYLLTTTGGDRPIRPLISYNTRLKAWVLDAGGVYGVKKKWKGKKQRIPAYIDGERVGFAQVREVEAGRSIVEFEPYADIIRRETYQAAVPSLLGKEIRVHLKGEAAGEDMLKSLIDQTKGLSLETDEEAADYCVLAQNGEWFITEPPDDRPLAAQQTGFGFAEAKKIISDLRVINKWAFTRDLQNEERDLPDDAILLECKLDGEMLSPTDDGFDIPLPDKDPPSGKVHFKMTNQSGQPLYFSILYLSSLFKVEALFEDNVRQIEPDEDWQISFPAGLEPYIIKHRWPAETLYLQVIASTDPFAVDLLLQEGLDMPRGERTRGFITSRGGQKDWRTFLYKIRLLNPVQ